MIKEPTRLAESDDGELGEELAALRRRLPSPERMAAIAGRLGAAGATVDAPEYAAPRSPGPTDPSPAPSANGSGSGARLVVLALIAGGALIAGAVHLREPEAPLQVVLPGTPVAPSPVSAAPVAPSPVSAAPVAPPTGAVVAQTTSPVSTGAAASPSPAVTERELVANPAAPSGASPAPVGVATARESTASPSAPPSRPEREGARRGANVPSAPGESSSDGARLAENTVVVSEIDLLKQARSALPSDPVQAFALTERCRAQYPRGGYAQEREFIAISALVRLGRADEARSRVSLFRMHYPSSAYLPKLTRMLGDE